MSGPVDCESTAQSSEAISPSEPGNCGAFKGLTVGEWLLNALHADSIDQHQLDQAAASDQSKSKSKSASGISQIPCIETEDQLTAIKQGARSWRDSKLWQPYATFLKQERIHQRLVRSQNGTHDSAYPSFLYLIAGTVQGVIKKKSTQTHSDVSHRVVSYVGSSFNPMLAVKQHNLVSRCNANRQKRVTNWRLVIFTGPLSRDHIKLWRDVWRSKRGVQSRLELILQFVIWSSAWLFGPSSLILRAHVQEQTLHMLHFLKTKRGTPEFIGWYDSFRHVLEVDSPNGAETAAQSASGD
jgi:hypothetical protein